MKQIPIQSRHGIIGHALIDDEDFDLVSAYRWYRNRKGYVVMNRNKDGVVQMSRLILGLLPHDGLQADHMNGEKFDNRRQNLRAVTAAQNAQNRRPYANTTSRYRGVTWERRNKKWMVRVKANGITHYFGLWEDEDEAGALAAEKRRELLPYATQ